MLAAELVPVRTKLECEERNITMKPRRWQHDPTLRRDVPQYTGTLCALPGTGSTRAQSSMVSLVSSHLSTISSFLLSLFSLDFAHSRNYKQTLEKKACSVLCDIKHVKTQKQKIILHKLHKKVNMNNIMGPQQPFKADTDTRICVYTYTCQSLFVGVPTAILTNSLLARMAPKGDVSYNFSGARIIFVVSFRLC